MKQATDGSCPGCGEAGPRVFLRMPEVPVNSVLLVRSRQEAKSFPRGDIELAFCDGCGFVFNRAFDPGRTEYSSRYEETQGYSGTFQAWHRALAERLVERHGLRGKRVVEIGCGKGEFLTLLCELGGNSGLGFDPAWVPDRLPPPQQGTVEFVRDFYSERHRGHQADLLCCKMTLEHIPDVADFVSTVRRSLSASDETMVFFQVPDVRRILEERAFWDVYYEHCSYFSAQSLAALFRRCGFEVLDVVTEYDGQYLALEARPTDRPAPDDGGRAGALALEPLVGALCASLPQQLDAWEERLDGYRDEGRSVVLWGGGSKAVAFLTALGGRPEIEAAVDINPHKHGYFLPGSGQMVVGPDHLDDHRPDVVIVMNPVYRPEIERELRAHGLEPEVVTP